MRRIINSTYITLDGVIEDPQDWPSGRHLDDGRGGELQTELLVGCDALLLGRHTYDAFVPVWTAMSGDPYSDHINAMEKWVVSSTLTHGLLDELRLWVHPFMLGKGGASDLLFRPDRAGQVELVDATPLASGIVVVSYRVA
jgi:dihydrofolate reductase